MKGDLHVRFLGGGTAARRSRYPAVYDLWVGADVEETYIDRIRLGDHLRVRFPSGMDKDSVIFFRGVDADYATQRDVSRTTQDIKTFEVRLRVDNTDRRIWPGLTAYVLLSPQDVR